MVIRGVGGKLPGGRSSRGSLNFCNPAVIKGVKKSEWDILSYNKINTNTNVCI